jgi:filamentous hemagglutinin
MAAFTRTGYKYVGDIAQPYVDRSLALKIKAETAAKAGDQATANTLRQQAEAIDRLWGNTGLIRAALHALVGGVAWGAPAALGNAANVLTANQQAAAVDAAMSAVGLSPTTDTTTRDILLSLSSTVVGAAAGGAQGAVAGFSADANNRQLHPDEAKLIMSKKATLVQRLAQNGITMSEAQAERMLTALVAEGVKQYSSAGEFRAIANGKAVEVAAVFMNEIGQQAGSFVDYRGQTIQYFKASEADYRVKDLYKSEYNTVELQDFAYRTQGLNLIGSNPTLAARNNFVAHKTQKNQETAVFAGALLAPVTIAATVAAAPALGAVAKECLLYWQLCASRLSMAFTDVFSGEYLGGGTVAGGLAAATQAAWKIENKVVETVAQEISAGANVVKSTTFYGGGGPLPSKVLETFRSGVYSEVVRDKPIVLYRVWGGDTKSLGAYWTSAEPKGPVQSIIDSALYRPWGNAATNVTKIQLPAGVKTYEGIAALQGGLVGGGNQVFILIEAKAEWIIR